MNKNKTSRFLSDPTNAAIAIGLIFFAFSVLWIPLDEWGIQKWIKSPGKLEHYEDFIEILFRVAASLVLIIIVRRKLVQVKKEQTQSQRYLNVVDVILVALNPDGKIKLLNRKGCRLLGVKEEEVVGKNWFDLFVSDENRQRAVSLFHQMIDGNSKGFENIEGQIKNMNGEKLLIAWGHSVLRDEKDRITGILSAGENITEKRELEKEVLEIREKEQLRIGQDLHDGIGQNLTAVTYMGQLLQKRLSSRGMPEANDASEVVKLVAKTIDQVRGVARGLYPIEISKNGFASGLQDLASTIEINHSVRCIVSVNQSVPINDDAVEIQLYRITQEAVNNALKHGQAKNIQIRLEVDEYKILLSIHDDGTGISNATKTSKGMGLNIMRYRTNLIGGTLEIRSVEHEGTTVTCLIPNPQTAASDNFSSRMKRYD